MPDNPLKMTPKQGWIIGGVVAAGVGVYVWWKHKQSASTAAVPTGYGYGMYGYGVSPIYGYGPGGSGGVGVTPTGYGYGSGNPPPITTNGQWAAAVEQSLAGQGYNPLTISAALGKYLTGQTVTQDQADLISVALAFQGDPPVPSPSGYPPGVHVGTSGGGNAKNPVSGLHVTKPGTTGVDIAWSASSGATSYNVTSDKGTVQMLGTTSARIRSINPSGKPASAHVEVLAEPAGTGAIPARLTVTTHK